MTRLENTSPNNGRSWTPGARAYAVLRTRRWPAARRIAITPPVLAGLSIAVVSAVIFLGGHSGIALIAVLIGMCVVGIAGHNA